MNGFRDHRAVMGFEQMRFYCHKKIPGKVFHVATKPNSLGEAVIQYFTGQGPKLTFLYTRQVATENFFSVAK